MQHEHLDVLILGAGLSGVGAACHLKRECPGKRFAIVERRSRIGGTWDLFRYPGIRSDSDMYTFGYNFKPWNGTKILADGSSIRSYIRETAQEYNVEKDIHFGLKIERVEWSSDDACWTAHAVEEASGEKHRFTANFLFGCTGYYNYDKGHRPDFPGESRFKGEIIHPQKWPEDKDYAGKNVVIIGSGATAITMVPAMAGTAKHVTMLQRSPTYIASIPSEDKLSGTLRRFLPDKLVYHMGRARNIALQRAIFAASRSRPGVVARALRMGVRRYMGKDFNPKDFTPSYNPWDERLCVVPNGDLFKALRGGNASIVTDHIDTFTENGIRLQSGKEIEADIIVSATGLDLQILGGAEMYVDGQFQDPGQALNYKGVMMEGVPNFALVFGYTNASWTLKADIASEFVCRLLNYMDAHKLGVVTPRDHEGCKTDQAFLDLQSGYIQRAVDRLPKQGSKGPWRVLQNYYFDLPRLRHGRINDGVLEFKPATAVRKPKRSVPKAANSEAPARSAAP
ncbi:flavin-containing monooxygenase [Algiphilus sp.]|uniref:flavin-containing monooxygenase n=1 Tax=Algiphilus sp. TaxID=1872431 RepID=UPI003B52A6AD